MSRSPLQGSRRPPSVLRRNVAAGIIPECAAAILKRESSASLRSCRRSDSQNGTSVRMAALISSVRSAEPVCTRSRSPRNRAASKTDASGDSTSRRTTLPCADNWTSYRRQTSSSGSRPFTAASDVSSCTESQDFPSGPTLLWLRYLHELGLPVLRVFGRMHFGRHSASLEGLNGRWRPIIVRRSYKGTP